MKRTLVSETVDAICLDKPVRLQGWINTKRDHGKMTFIDLRDHTGIVQCVARGIKAGLFTLHELAYEDVIEIEGIVQSRPEKLINPKMETGEVEISVGSIKVLNKAKELPIPVDGDGRDIKEEKRLAYRYLDLRRPRLQENLRMRSEFIQALREGMAAKDMLEIETPILSKATKEGARDFVVPSRLQPGMFYALPQSPQQYKQLLMASGFENYFQFARCFRDEGLRSDRAFEFTQLDIEFAFPDAAIPNTVMSNTQEILFVALGNLGHRGVSGSGSCQIISYKHAMETYGTDKPDLRTEQEKKDGVLKFCWVIHYPFFKKNDDVDKTRSGWSFTHNPFSRPIAEHEEWHRNGENIDQIIAEQYDLVCNGVEVGGGSLRAHEANMLRSTYKIMGYTDEEIEQSVGHMLQAFDLGTPPHGGIALGIDRILMLMTGEESLKEVTAFPTTNGGRTSVMEAPTALTEETLKELNINLRK